MKNTQTWVAVLSLWGRWEKPVKRGAIGRTSGITERNMASLEGKPNVGIQDSSSSWTKNWRTVGRCWAASWSSLKRTLSSCKAQMGRQNAPVLHSKINLATTEAVTDSNKLKTKSRYPPPCCKFAWPILSQLCTNMGISLWGRAPKLAQV